MKKIQITKTNLDTNIIGEALRDSKGFIFENQKDVRKAIAEQVDVILKRIRKKNP